MNRSPKTLWSHKLLKLFKWRSNAKHTKVKKWIHDNNAFVPVEDPIRGIVRNEVLHAMGTAKLPDRNCNVSLVGKKPGGKCSRKPSQRCPINQENQPSRSKSANRMSNQPWLLSKNAQGKGSSSLKRHNHSNLLLYLPTYANLLVYLGRVRQSEGKLCCPRTQHNDLSQGLILEHLSEV